MPELPEVETTRRGLLAQVQGCRVISAQCTHLKLRAAIPPLATLLPQQTLHTITRRSKYLYFEFDVGVMVSHLGMTGHWLFYSEPPLDWLPHTHIRLQFAHGWLVYVDPRRFGAVYWADWQQWHDPTGIQHRLTANLGVEPLSDDFTVAHLSDGLSQRRSPIKQVLLSGEVVVGVGNIYASESLFLAKVHPATPASQITANQIVDLHDAIRHTLTLAIAAGGSTLKDFKHVDGKPGYFQMNYWVYGRANLPCLQCDVQIIKIVQQQRSTFFCPCCQLS
jgi:formamidopyrimidine-DNA glycosylase